MNRGARSDAIRKGWAPYHVHGTFEDFGAPGAESYNAILAQYVAQIEDDGMVVHPDHRELEYDGSRITVHVLVIVGQRTMLLL